MDRNDTRDERPAACTPAPGRPALLRHLALVGSHDRTPRTLRDAIDDGDWLGRWANGLARIAGGLDVLEAIGTDPLPDDEPFDSTGLDDATLATARAVLDVLHDFRPPLFDAVSRLGHAYTPWWLQGEYLTIVHRLVARAARSGTAPWHREPRRTAAAFAWLALGGNCGMGRSCAVSAQDIWRWYDVGDCRALARRLCVDAKLGSLYVPDDEAMALRDLHVVFADPRVLHSSFRTHLARQRDDIARSIVEDDRRRSAQRPVQSIGDGQISFRGRQVRPVWSIKAPSLSGKSAVMLAFGQSTDDDDYELVGLSVPDARELVRLLHDALDAPSTSGTMRGVRTDGTKP
jgi:hypothetical protein